MGVLKVKDPADPTGQTWVDIAGTGSVGPPGGPVPVGGNPGEVIVKTGPADMEVGWARVPRLAFTLMPASTISHATANTFVDLVAGQATIYPDRTYWVTAGARGVEDPGATSALAQYQVAIGTVNLAGYDVVATHDTGLWGAWSQTWVEDGSRFVPLGDPPASLDVRLRGMLSVASKTFYSPRLHILEI
jgi:hypothetical protein